MCGRFALSAKTEDIEKLKPKIKIDSDFKPRYNIAPTQSILAVLNKNAELAVNVKWGLIPFWAKDSSMTSKMINARAETLTEKPSFKKLISDKRCLILASGFFEWNKFSNSKIKTPYYIFINGEPLVTFAGLWDQWTNTTTGEIVNTATIITTESNSFMRKIHDRMPVFIQENERTKWLDTSTNMNYVLDLLKPQDELKMDAFQIGTEVNSPLNDYPELLLPKD